MQFNAAKNLYERHSHFHARPDFDQDAHGHDYLELSGHTQSSLLDTAAVTLLNRTDTSAPDIGQFRAAVEDLVHRWFQLMGEDRVLHKRAQIALIKQVLPQFRAENLDVEITCIYRGTPQELLADMLKSAPADELLRWFYSKAYRLGGAVGVWLEVVDYDEAQPAAE